MLPRVNTRYSDSMSSSSVVRSTRARAGSRSVGTAVRSVPGPVCTRAGKPRTFASGSLTNAGRVSSTARASGSPSSSHRRPVTCGSRATNHCGDGPLRWVGAPAARAAATSPPGARTAVGSVPHSRAKRAGSPDSSVVVIPTRCAAAVRSDAVARSAYRHRRGPAGVSGSCRRHGASAGRAGATARQWAVPAPRRVSGPLVGSRRSASTAPPDSAANRTPTRAPLTSTRA